MDTTVRTADATPREHAALARKARVAAAHPRRAVAGALLLAASAAAAPALAQDKGDYRNLTAGGTLRAGVYGRIVVRGAAEPPPVIYPDPVIASQPIVPQGARPVYLYVPPGQVRKWKDNCAKWKACDEPVLFVRMENSPSRWGRWKQLREQFALHGQE